MHTIEVKKDGFEQAAPPLSINIDNDLTESIHLILKTN